MDQAQLQLDLIIIENGPRAVVATFKFQVFIPYISLKIDINMKLVCQQI